MYTVLESGDIIQIFGSEPFPTDFWDPLIVKKEGVWSGHA